MTHYSVGLTITHFFKNNEFILSKHKESQRPSAYSKSLHKALWVTAKKV